MIKVNVEPPKSDLSLSSFFTKKDILILGGRMSRNEAIRALLEHLSQANDLSDLELHYQAIIERENNGSTVVGDGIALPHARLSNLDKSYVGVATSQEGIEFVEGGERIHLMMMILIPSSQPGLYLQMLRALATILSIPQTASKLAEMQSVDEIMRFFERNGLRLPDYVCAADIMRRDFIALRENNSLHAAIDCFISKDSSEIAVVDKDGDMIGVVSATALLQICLPEYLTWMSDLSPIINFEPFTNVLHNEEQAYLADILIEDFPSVQVDAPAISVASEMLKRKVSSCYVLDDKNLKGIITLPSFLSKIFRE
ncbi:MAG: PTS sugar transporter subunit IIA [Kiritimatiellia bacterium]